MRNTTTDNENSKQLYENTNNNTITHQFTYDNPITWNGNTYPTAEMMIDNTKRQVFADPDGGIWTIENNTPVRVNYQHTLKGPTVIYSKVLGKQVPADENGNIDTSKLSFEDNQKLSYDLLKQKGERSAFHPEDVSTVTNAMMGPFSLVLTNPFKLTQALVDKDYKTAGGEALKYILPMDNIAGHAADFVQGTTQVLGENGIKKTINHLKNGEYTKAAFSGLGDLVNAGMTGYGTAKLLDDMNSEPVRKVVNNIASKLSNLRNSFLRKPAIRTFNYNNTKYTISNDVDDASIKNYFKNANGLGKHIEWYPENYEKYAQIIRDNGLRYLDQKGYRDNVRNLARDLASNENLMYSKDFQNKIQDAANMSGINSMNLTQDIQTAARMLNFKPIPARPKYEIPIEELTPDNFSTLRKSVTGVYYPEKHTMYMEFDANGNPTDSDALSTWLHENEHYFQDLFPNQFNSKVNQNILNSGYKMSPGDTKYMSAVDDTEYPEAAAQLDEKGSTNKEHLLPYYKHLIDKNEDSSYENVNKLVDEVGDTQERMNLSDPERAVNDYDSSYIHRKNNFSNYKQAVIDFSKKYEQEYNRKPTEDELIQYMKKFDLSKYQQEFPTLPQEISYKSIMNRLNALKYGLGLLPVIGAIQNQKQGGKMKISFGKSGIHIKKQNEGKFTSYCGGKVTQDCINRAKASGNSKLVKRAVFADNARRWKHQNGGTLKKKVKLEDGNYLEVSNLDKDQLAGRKSIGTYKGIPQYLKGDGTAGPSYKGKQIKKAEFGMEVPIDPPDDSFVQLAYKSGSGAQAAPKLKKIYYDAKSNGATEQQAAAATITAAFESHGNYLAKNGRYKGLGQWDPSRYPGGYLNQIKTLLAKNKSQWSSNGYAQFTNPASTPADTTRVYTRDFIRGGNPITRARIATQLFGMTENK